jgi:hypothetical protein
MSRSASLNDCKKIVAKGGKFTPKFAAKAIAAAGRCKEKSMDWQNIVEYIANGGVETDGEADRSGS